MSAFEGRQRRTWYEVVQINGLELRASHNSASCSSALPTEFQDAVAPLFIWLIAHQRRASIRHNEGAHGSDTLPDDDAAEGRRRDGALGAGLQTDPRHEHRRHQAAAPAQAIRSLELLRARYHTAKTRSGRLWPVTAGFYGVLAGEPFGPAGVLAKSPVAMARARYSAIHT